MLVGACSRAAELGTIDIEMANLSSIGIYIPRYRIEAAEVNKAWNRSGGRGQKSIAAPDEDVLTMGVRAAKACLENSDINATELGAIYFCSVSSGYSEYALAAQVGTVLGTRDTISAADFGLSTRVVGSAIQSANDAVNSGRLEHVLVIASDQMRSEPGSSYELNYGAGAGAVLVSKHGFAEISNIASCTSNFIGRSKQEGAYHGLVDDRFVMKHGFISETSAAIENLGLDNQSVDKFIVQSPDARWSGRLLKILKVNPEALSSSAGQIGYAGCASFLIDLSVAINELSADQNMLGITYGPGGSDAIGISIVSRFTLNPNLDDSSKNTQLLSYPEYLRYTGMIGD
jgi:3-hydroxy-3-methylglutaryl CoA synthase